MSKTNIKAIESNEGSEKMIQDFMIGPFKIHQVARGLFDICYGKKTLAHRIAAGDGETRQAIADGLRVCLSRLVQDMVDKHQEEHLIELVNSEGERLGSFFSTHPVLPGMTQGLVDDCSPLYLRSADRLRSMPVSLKDYLHVVQKYQAPARAWVAKLLPKDILQENPNLWRTPTSWEIRHIVGEGSFTGISGAKAASLIGISPTSFRKYTAADDAKSRQRISFAAWHLLLQRLCITKPLTTYL